ncbi:MAG: hypothetical protein PHE15_00035 [Dehalococcoidales bacterium]|nr:hypothetical protein [Dehalococcoidales bacterium]
MPIKGLSEQRQMPRLGKIRTGVKVANKSGNGEHPESVDYFVLPDELKEVFGDKPKSLPIMFPVEDETKFANQFYKCYSSFRGLVCKGDGETCYRLIDAKTGDFAHRDTVETIRREMPCSGRDCTMYQQKKCKEVMNLQFLLPSVPGLGVWQLDTSSYHSIVAVNSAIELIRNICGRISMIPLRLTIEPKEVSPDGKKKTVNILQIRTDITLAEIQKLGALSPSKVMLPPPDEDKPDLLYPDTEDEVITASKEQAGKDIEDIWPDDSTDADKDFDNLESASVKETIKESRDPSTIKTLTQLMKACNEDFDMQPAQVCKALGYKSQNEITDLPSECYLKIKAVQE